VPRLSTETVAQIEADGAWLNRAIQGRYPPGSTFKIVTSVAGLRNGVIDAHASQVVCPGYLMVGRSKKMCHIHAGHGSRDLVGAIRDSCDVFFYTYGIEMGPDFIASEARRFGLGHPTGIELPFEFAHPIVPDRKWKTEHRPDEGRWSDGDSANYAIGQGYLLVSPLQVACFVASFARGETETQPTLLHDANRPPQHSAPIGLSRDDYNAILEGMEQCVQLGTGKMLIKENPIPGLRIAAKTGTAQWNNKRDMAWMIAFAPVENPQIAIAVALEGQDPDAEFGGGTYSAPVVKAVLQAWAEKHKGTPGPSLRLH
jgi:penicillin-binding protein 2